MIFDNPVPVWLMLGSAPIVVPLLLSLILTYALHMRSGCLSLVILVSLGFLCAFGICTYLDSLGKLVVGEVLELKETLSYHPDGSWDRKMLATIRYQFTDGAPYNTLTLDLLPARFDELHQGDFMQLRIPQDSDFFRIVRVENETTGAKVLSWIGGQPFFFVFGAGALLVLGARFGRPMTLPRLFFLSGLVIIGAWWISTVAMPLWQQATIRTGSLNTVSATVREIHQPYVTDGPRAWISDKLFMPDQLILLDIIPLGRSQALLSVDMVDLGSSNLRPGQSVNVEYSPGAPRFALVPDATRDYIWKNALMSTFLAALILFIVAKIVSLLSEHQDPAQVRSRLRVPR